MIAIFLIYSALHSYTSNQSRAEVDHILQEGDAKTLSVEVEMDFTTSVRSKGVPTYGS